MAKKSDSKGCMTDALRLVISFIKPTHLIYIILGLTGFDSR